MLYATSSDTTGTEVWYEPSTLSWDVYTNGRKDTYVAQSWVHNPNNTTITARQAWRVNSTCDWTTGTTAGNDWTIDTTLISADSIVNFTVRNGYANIVSVFMQEKKKRKWAPPILNHRGQYARAQDKGQLWSDVPPEELVALQLLRKMVTVEVFKKYLKHGFVTVEGPSGLSYQIPRGQDRIVVWDKGERVASLCIHLRDWYNKPPTDEVVGKLLIAECDEPDLWKRSNIAWLTLYRDRPGLHAIGRGGPSVAAPRALAA